MSDVVLTVSLRPQWQQRMMSALDSDDVARRMETIAVAALRQFTRERNVVVTATQDGETRTLVRDRWDLSTAPLVVELRAHNVELLHRILVLEETLRAAGVPIPGLTPAEQ